MQPETPGPANNDPKGLPPVAPPSGRFILQLFLVPGLIVAVAVLIVLGFQFLAGGTRSADDFMRDLKDPNPDVRWRAASELSQVLMRPESLKLASDPKFGLDLAERLQTALDDLREAEEKEGKQLARDIKEQTKELGEKQQHQKRQELEKSYWDKLAAKRSNVMFLGACLGNLTTPVGAPLLCQIAADGKGSDKKALALRRRQAILALAKLGDNLKRFRKLEKEDQEEFIEQLEKETGGKSDRGRWAKAALDYLKDRTPLDVDKTLAVCAKDNDPFIRMLVAFALKYWDGDLVEPTLVKLSRDDGHGEIINVDE
jgi:hypothetical protein